MYMLLAEAAPVTSRIDVASAVFFRLFILFPFLVIDTEYYLIGIEHTSCHSLYSY
jgi:hypothetical protein